MSEYTHPCEDGDSDDNPYTPDENTTLATLLDLQWVKNVHPVETQKVDYRMNTTLSSVDMDYHIHTVENLGFNVKTFVAVEGTIVLYGSLR